MGLMEKLKDGALIYHMASADNGFVTAENDLYYSNWDGIRFTSEERQHLMKQDIYVYEQPSAVGGGPTPHEILLNISEFLLAAIASGITYDIIKAKFSTVLMHLKQNISRNKQERKAPEEDDAGTVIRIEAYRFNGVTGDIRSSTIFFEGLNESQYDETVDKLLKSFITFMEEPD